MLYQFSVNCNQKVMKSSVIFVFVLFEVIVGNEDNLEISFYGRRGKTHNRPQTKPTEPPELELEPETEINISSPVPEKPDVWVTTQPESENNWVTVKTTTSQRPKPENDFWVTIPTKPEQHFITMTSTTRKPTVRPEPEYTTKRTTTPEPQTTRPSIRTTTTGKPTPDLDLDQQDMNPQWEEEPNLVPEWEPPSDWGPEWGMNPEWGSEIIQTTVKTTTTTKPKPEIETTRPTPFRPKPETEAITTTRKPRPQPESEPSLPSLESESEHNHPIYTPFPTPYPSEDNPPFVCQQIRCRTGYRCDCVNPCPATCKQPNQQPCPNYNVCKAGCVCATGYVLNDTGNCIPVQSCPKPELIGPVCNKMCANGKQCVCDNPCPPTCADPEPKPCPTLQCNPGCHTVCRKGYVLDRIGGDCIPLQYCPNRQCVQQSSYDRENEVFYECSTRHCNRTCLNPKPHCTGHCIKPGNYDCRPGYVRDLRDGRCVLIAECNQKILCDRKDEIFYECDTRVCQKTCQRPNPLCPALCLQPGNCDCRPGMVRDVRTCRCVDKNEPTCVAQRAPED